MANDKKRRVGILTSGGDCPGLNAVIRGTVKSAERHGFETVGFIKGYEGLVDPVTYIPLNSQNTSGILNQGGTILSSTNKGRFAARIGVEDRLDLDPKLLAGVKTTCDMLGLDGLICVGGDGSLAVAQQFHEYGIPVVGVPKTIDNDLSATAFTFGFDSAVACATDALDRLHTTAASHERIMVMEVMGRHAGWIALYAGIAGGGDVILIPEIQWTFEGVCAKILSREKYGKRFTLIVVAEGAELPDGDIVTQELRQETRQTRLGGIGNVVAYEIEQRLGRECRVVVLGHLQRGGNPTTFDRVLATQFGAHAVRLVIEGRFGEMVCYNPPAVDSVPIIDAVNQLSRVELDSSVVQAARALGISFGDKVSAEGPFSQSAAARARATELSDQAAPAVTASVAEPQAAEPTTTTSNSPEPATTASDTASFATTSVAASGQASATDGDESATDVPLEWEIAAAYKDSQVW
jgi:6-phosphofructokinase 1